MAKGNRIAESIAAAANTAASYCLIALRDGDTANMADFARDARAAAAMADKEYRRMDDAQSAADAEYNRAAKNGEYAAMDKIRRDSIAYNRAAIKCMDAAANARLYAEKCRDELARIAAADAADADAAADAAHDAPRIALEHAAHDAHSYGFNDARAAIASGNPELMRAAAIELDARIAAIHTAIENCPLDNSRGFDSARRNTIRDAERMADDARMIARQCRAIAANPAMHEAILYGPLNADDAASVAASAEWYASKGYRGPYARAEGNMRASNQSAFFAAPLDKIAAECARCGGIRTILNDALCGNCRAESDAHAAAYAAADAAAQCRAECADFADADTLRAAAEIASAAADACESIADAMADNADASALYAAAIDARQAARDARGNARINHALDTRHDAEYADENQENSAICSECGREMGMYDYACSDACGNARAARMDAARNADAAESAECPPFANNAAAMARESNTGIQSPIAAENGVAANVAPMAAISTFADIAADAAAMMPAIRAESAAFAAAHRAMADDAMRAYADAHAAADDADSAAADARAAADKSGIPSDAAIVRAAASESAMYGQLARDAADMMDCPDDWATRDEMAANMAVWPAQISMANAAAAFAKNAASDCRARMAEMAASANLSAAINDARAVYEEVSANCAHWLDDTDAWLEKVSHARVNAIYAADAMPEFGPMASAWAVSDARDIASALDSAYREIYDTRRYARREADARARRDYAESDVATLRAGYDSAVSAMAHAWPSDKCDAHGAPSYESAMDAAAAAAAAIELHVRAMTDIGADADDTAPSDAAEMRECLALADAIADAINAYAGQLAMDSNGPFDAAPYIAMLARGYECRCAAENARIECADIIAMPDTDDAAADAGFTAPCGDDAAAYCAMMVEARDAWIAAANADECPHAAAIAYAHAAHDAAIIATQFAEDYAMDAAADIRAGCHADDAADYRRRHAIARAECAAMARDARDASAAAYECAGFMAGMAAYGYPGESDTDAMAACAMAGWNAAHAAMDAESESNLAIESYIARNAAYSKYPYRDNAESGMLGYRMTDENEVGAPIIRRCASDAALSAIAIK